MKRIGNTQGSFESREQLVGVYAMTKLTYACGVNMETPHSATQYTGKVHSVLTNKKTKWRCQAITMTMHVRGHLVDPFQAERYTAVRTMRRLITKREKLRKEFQEVWKEYIKVREEKKKWDAHGPVTLLAHVFEVLRWEINEDLVITREKGVKLLLHDGARWTI